MTSLRPILRHRSQSSVSVLSSKDDHHNPSHDSPTPSHPLGYGSSHSTAWRGNTLQMKWFVVVEYDSTLLITSDSYDKRKRERECDESSEGGSVLLLLQPTAHQQLVHLLSHLHLPSPLGLSLHLFIPSSSTTPTPRLTDAIWPTFFSTFLLPTPGTPHVHSNMHGNEAYGGLPIAARLKLKVNPDARWYDAWKKNPDDGTVARWVDLGKVNRDVEHLEVVSPAAHTREPHLEGLVNNDTAEIPSVAFATETLSPPSGQAAYMPVDIDDGLVQAAVIEVETERVQPSSPLSAVSSFGYSSSIPYSASLSPPASAALATQPFLQELQSAVDRRLPSIPIADSPAWSRRSPGLSIIVPQKAPWADLATAPWSAATSWGPPSDEAEWSPGGTLQLKGSTWASDEKPECEEESAVIDASPFRQSVKSLISPVEDDIDSHGSGAFLPNPQISPEPWQRGWPFHPIIPMPEPLTLKLFPRVLDDHQLSIPELKFRDDVEQVGSHGTGAFLPHAEVSASPWQCVWPFHPLIPMPEPETLKDFPRDLDTHYQCSLSAPRATDPEDVVSDELVSDTSSHFGSDLEFEVSFEQHDVQNELDPFGDEHYIKAVDEVPSSATSHHDSTPPSIAFEYTDLVIPSPSTLSFDFTRSPISPLELIPSPSATYVADVPNPIGRLPPRPAPPVPSLAQLQAMTEDIQNRSRPAPLGPRPLPNQARAPSFFGGVGTFLEDIEEVESPVPSPASVIASPGNRSPQYPSMGEVIVSATSAHDQSPLAAPPPRPTLSSPVSTPHELPAPSLPNPRSLINNRISDFDNNTAFLPALANETEETVAAPAAGGLGHSRSRSIPFSEPGPTVERVAPFSNEMIIDPVLDAEEESKPRRSLFRSLSKTDSSSKMYAQSSKARESTFSISSTMSVSSTMTTGSKAANRPLKRLSQSIGSFSEAPGAAQSRGLNSPRETTISMGSSMYGSNGYPDLQIYPAINRQTRPINGQVHKLSYPIIELYAPRRRGIVILEDMRLYPQMLIYPPHGSKRTLDVNVSLVSYEYPKIVLYPAVKLEKVGKVNFSLTSYKYPHIVLYPPVISMAKREINVNLVSFVYPDINLYPIGKRSNASSPIEERAKPSPKSIPVDLESVKVLLAPMTYPSLVIYPVSPRAFSSNRSAIKVTLTKSSYPSVVIYPPVQQRRTTQIHVTLAPITYPSLVIYPAPMKTTNEPIMRIRPEQIKVLLRPFAYPNILIYPNVINVKLTSYLYPNIVLYPKKVCDVALWHPAFGGYTRDTIPSFNDEWASRTDTGEIHPAWIGRIQPRQKGNDQIVDGVTSKSVLDHTSVQTSAGAETSATVSPPGGTTDLLANARDKYAALKASLGRIDTMSSPSTSLKPVHPHHTRHSSSISSVGSAGSSELQTPVSTPSSSTRAFGPANKLPPSTLPPLPITYSLKDKRPAIIPEPLQNGLTSPPVTVPAPAPATALSPQSTGTRTPPRSRSSTLISERMKAFDHLKSPPLPPSGLNVRGIRSSTYGTMSQPVIPIDTSDTGAPSVVGVGEEKKVGKLPTSIMRNWV